MRRLWFHWGHHTAVIDCAQMPDQTNEIDLIRLLAAEVHHSNEMATAREMFGKGFFELDTEQRTALEVRLIDRMGVLYAALSREGLGKRFQTPISEKIQ